MAYERRVNIDNDDREDAQREISDRQEDRQDFVNDELDEHDD